MRDDFLFATYASVDYIPYLENCVSGCARFLKARPVVYAFDKETAEAAGAWGCDVEEVPEYCMERHLFSLEILKRGGKRWTVLIDADCWPLRVINLDSWISMMEDRKLDFVGDVGQMDLEYLFKTTNRVDMLLHMHEVLRTFPQFATLWGNAANVVPVRPSCGNVVVDLPLLYGGFGIYRTSAFQGIVYPTWIHSADIWLSMYAIEHGIKWQRIGKFQFNRRMDVNEDFLHFAGVKSDSCVPVAEKYKDRLKGMVSAAVP